MTFWLTAIYRLRPKSTWLALAAGVVVCFTAATFVLVPVLSLIGAGAPFAPFVRIPVAQITVAIIGGYTLALGLLVLAGLSRVGVLSWILSVAAMLATVVVSLYPVLAVGLAAVHNIGDAIPWIVAWIARVRTAIG